MYLTARPTKLVSSNSDLKKLANAKEVCDDIAELCPEPRWRDNAAEVAGDLANLAAYLQSDQVRAPDEPAE